MWRLEAIFEEGTKALGLTHDQLRKRAEFNFDAKLEKANFESFRALLRAASALRSKRFSVSLVNSASLGDLVGERNGRRFAIEVKSYIYQGHEWAGGEIGSQRDKWRDRLTHKVSNEHIPTGKKQLKELAERERCGARLLLVVPNRSFITMWFGEEDFRAIYDQLKCKLQDAQIDYLCFLKDSFFYDCPSMS